MKCYGLKYFFMVLILLTGAGEKVYGQVRDAFVFEQVRKSIVYFVGVTFTDDENAALGTGFVISPDGLIITNAHVLAGSTYVFVVLHDNSQVAIEKVLYYDPVKDFCILKTNAKDLVPLKLGDSENVQKGDDILVVGNPNGDREVLSLGKIHQRIDSKTGQYFHLTTQTTSGSSGSPLMTLNGEVIGVVSGRGWLGDGEFSMATAINEVKPFLNKESLSLSWAEFIQRDDIKGVGLFAKGQAAADRKDYVSQIEFLNEAKKFWPNSPSLFYNLAQAYAQVGRLDDATANFQAVLAIEPKHYNSNYNLSVLYGNKNNVEKAIDYAQRAIDSDPNSSSGYERLIKIYEDLGQAENSALIKQRLNSINK